MSLLGGGSSDLGGGGLKRLAGGAQAIGWGGKRLVWGLGGGSREFAGVREQGHGIRACPHKTVPNGKIFLDKIVQEKQTK